VHVSISGTPEEVQWATEMVNKLVQESGKGIACCGKGSGSGKGKGNRRERETDLSEALEYEEETFGAIVGKGGAVIHQIRRDSGAHVSVDKVLGKCQVQITGSLEQCERAKGLIWQNTEAQSWEGEKTESFEFDKQAMGNIIGPAAKRIQDARKQTGAMITVRKTDNGCQVVIAGMEAEVQHAKDVVLEIVGSGGQSGSDIHSGSWNDRWEHKKDQKHEEVDWKAREAREEEESDIDDEVDMTMPPPEAKMVSKIVAKICDDSGAIVTIDEQTDKSVAKVNIRGRLRAVDRARAMVYDIISGSKGRGRRRRRDDDGDWDEEEFLRLGFVDSKRTIGRGGSKVQELERHSWANIEVAKSQGGPCLVRITGSFEAVSEACRLIEDSLPSTFRPKLGKRKLIQTEFPDFGRGRSRSPPRKSKRPEPAPQERQPPPEAPAPSPAQAPAPAEQAVPEMGAPLATSEQQAPVEQWAGDGTAGQETTAVAATGEGTAEQPAEQQYTPDEWEKWEKEQKENAEWEQQGEGEWEQQGEGEWEQQGEGAGAEGGAAEQPKKRSLLASLLAKHDD